MIQLIVAGNIGKDAQTRTAGDTTVTGFSVASSRKDKKSGKEITTWVNCSLWGQRGEALEQYLTKGKSVTVLGELTTREYEKDGETRTSIECRVSDVKLQGGKNDGGSSGGGRQSDNSGTGNTGDDDDIPF